MQLSVPLAITGNLINRALLARLGNIDARQKPSRALHIVPRTRTHVRPRRLSRTIMTYTRSIVLTTLVLATTMTVRAMEVDLRSDFPRLDATVGTSEFTRDDITAVPMSGDVIHADTNDTNEFAADMIDWDESGAADEDVIAMLDTVVFDIPARPPRRAGPMFYANDDVASMPATWYYAVESTNGMLPMPLDAMVVKWSTWFDWISFCDDLCTMMCLGFCISIFVVLGLMFFAHDDDDDDDDDDDGRCKHCKRCKRCGSGRKEIVLRCASDDAVDEDLLPLLRSALNEASEEGKCKQNNVCDVC